MSERILFNQNFGDLEWTGTTTKRAVLPPSTLIIPEPLLEAENYFFDLDGVIYECTGVSDTSSYLTFRYDVEGANVLYVRLDKSQETINISIKVANFPDVNFETSILKLIETTSPIVIEGTHQALIKFNRICAIKVGYDESSEAFTYETIIDGELPSTESKEIKYAIIRFSIDKAVKVIYNENDNSVELEVLS